MTSAWVRWHALGGGAGLVTAAVCWALSPGSLSCSAVHCGHGAQPGPCCPPVGNGGRAACVVLLGLLFAVLLVTNCLAFIHWLHMSTLGAFGIVVNQSAFFLSHFLWSHCCVSLCYPLWDLGSSPTLSKPPRSLWFFSLLDNPISFFRY